MTLSEEELVTGIKAGLKDRSVVPVFCGVGTTGVGTQALLQAILDYVRLGEIADLSLVRITLRTGRTHQIRAHFAHAGHPLLGDGKYGKLDKRFDRTYQALYSYKLTFLFTTDAGSLSNLNGRSFQVEKVDFVEEYFPAKK